jgi:hypothetical protein
VKEIPVSTRRLDDIAEISAMDFLKIDAQGSELSVVRHGHRCLMQAVAIQTEVSFVPLYHDQPTFGEIDNEMRRMDFVRALWTGEAFDLDRQPDPRARLRGAGVGGQRRV